MTDKNSDLPPDGNGDVFSRSMNRRLLSLTLLLAAMQIILVSQAVAYGDEGFHVLAASLVSAGEMPYRDFFYQHPPLFPYLYAAWMQITGEHWRSTHLLSALLTIGTVFLVARHVSARYSGSQRYAGLFAVALLCLNPQFLWLGTIGHPYALAMFLGMLAFHLVTDCVRLNRAGFAVAGGLAAGGAVLSSLLVAPILPVMAIWILVCNARPHALAMFVRFAAGAAFWLLPLGWLFVQAPHPMFFEIVSYHLDYRGPGLRSTPPDAFLTGLRQLVTWGRSWEGIIASLLAIVGIWKLMFGPPLASRHGREAMLAFALAGSLALFLCLPYPSFPYYFVVITPFLILLSCLGINTLATSQWTLRRYGIVAATITTIVAGVILKPANRQIEPIAESMSQWEEAQSIAELINREVPRDAPIFAGENIYFAAQRRPPPGLENSYAAELQIAPGFAASLNTALEPQIDEWIREQKFAAVVLDRDDPRNRWVAASRHLGAYSVFATASHTVYFFDRTSR